MNFSDLTDRLNSINFARISKAEMQSFIKKYENNKKKKSLLMKEIRELSEYPRKNKEEIENKQSKIERINNYLSKNKSIYNKYKEKLDSKPNKSKDSDTSIEEPKTNNDKEKLQNDINYFVKNIQKKYNDGISFEAEEFFSENIKKYIIPGFNYLVIYANGTKDYFEVKDKHKIKLLRTNSWEEEYSNVDFKTKERYLMEMYEGTLNIMDCITEPKALTSITVNPKQETIRKLPTFSEYVYDCGFELHFKNKKPYLTIDDGQHNIEEKMEKLGYSDMDEAYEAQEEYLKSMGIK